MEKVYQTIFCDEYNTNLERTSKARVVVTQAVGRQHTCSNVYAVIIYDCIRNEVT